MYNLINTVFKYVYLNIYLELKNSKILIILHKILLNLEIIYSLHFFGFIPVCTLKQYLFPR
jgi:hypothetical protein